MSLVKVEIERIQTESVRKRTFGDAPQQRTIFLQKIWMYRSGSKHPTEYEIQLPEGVTSYPSGLYVFDIQATTEPSKYGALSFAGFSSTTLYPVNQNYVDNLDKMENALFEQLHKQAA